MRSFRPRSAGVAIAAALLLPAAAAASDWHWSLTPYVWASGVGMDAKIHDQQVVDSTTKFSDLIDQPKFAFQVNLQGQHGKHGFLVDANYVSVGDGQSRVTLPGPGSPTWVAEADLRQTLVDVAGIYNPQGDGEGFGLLYGARIFDVTPRLQT